ncbi:uncharacterized protein LOC102617183 [Citrus sinensis]|uniref:uncharacterized protein LOC102617183 n=1 Tax=Citrus sinensis TaxID=2711 RepID=UPI0022779C09|nr:uncharacterized protein LOC102617183 [Citrus sinensis]XP_052294350.1 uncharacterized protein LOC102617183 [Citrus sinensis]XP_052294351.1 uncharacterized protein LOC102617183 [Citrus sinensis]
MLVPKFNRSLNLGLPKLNEDRSGNIVHAEHAVFRWFAVGLDGDSGFPTSFQSEPSSVEPVEHKRGVKPLVLVNNNLAEDNDEVRGNLSRSPGGPVAENVWPDVLSAYKIVKNELEKKPTIARFGEVHFHRYVIWFPLLLQRECFVNNLLHLGSEKEGQAAEETTLRQMK